MKPEKSKMKEIVAKTKIVEKDFSETDYMTADPGNYLWVELTSFLFLFIITSWFIMSP